MTNSITTQPVPTAPQPVPAAPQFPLDPTNPLAWILLLTALLGNTDEVITAITKLIQTIASLKNRSHNRDKTPDRDK